MELVNVELKCDGAKVLRIFDLQSKREPGRGPRAINETNDPSNPNDRLVVGFSGGRVDISRPVGRDRFGTR